MTELEVLQQIAEGVGSIKSILHIINFGVYGILGYCLGSIFFGTPQR